MDPTLASKNLKSEKTASERDRNDIELTAQSHIPYYINALKSRPPKATQLRLLDLIRHSPPFVLHKLVEDDVFLNTLRTISNDLANGVDADADVALALVQALAALPFTLDILKRVSIGKRVKKFLDLNHGPVFIQEVRALMKSWKLLYEQQGVPQTPVTPMPATPGTNYFPAAQDVKQEVQANQDVKPEAKQVIQAKPEVKPEVKQVIQAKPEVKPEVKEEIQRKEGVNVKLGKDVPKEETMDVWQEHIDPWAARKEKEKKRKEEEAKLASELAIERAKASAYEAAPKLEASSTPRERTPSASSMLAQLQALEAPPRTSSPDHIPSEEPKTNPLKRYSTDEGVLAKYAVKKARTDVQTFRRNSSGVEEKKSNLKREGFSKGLRVKFPPDEELVQVREFEVEEGERTHHVPSADYRRMEKAEGLNLTSHKSAMQTRVAWTSLDGQSFLQRTNLF
jgi:hypothetical protein